MSIFVDGIPVAVAADAELLSTLDPDLVERVEVIPGPSLLCSGQAQAEPNLNFGCPYPMGQLCLVSPRQHYSLEAISKSSEIC